MKTNTKMQPNSKLSDEGQSMTVTPNKPKRGQPTASLPIPETNQKFNWKNCWYPITFLQDLPKDRPYRAFLSTTNLWSYSETKMVS